MNGGALAKTLACCTEQKINERPQLSESTDRPAGKCERQAGMSLAPSGSWGPQRRWAALSLLFLSNAALPAFTWYICLNKCVPGVNRRCFPQPGLLPDNLCPTCSHGRHVCAWPRAHMGG